MSLATKTHLYTQQKVTNHSSLVCWTYYIQRQASSFLSSSG